MTQSVETHPLQAYLDAQRRHVLGAIDGLDDLALRRPALPSGWTCLGLIQHLTIDIERFWFRAVVAGEREVINDFERDWADGWQVSPDLPAQSVIDSYRSEIARTNAIIAATPLTASPTWWPAELFGDWRLDDLQDVLLHVLTETACHSGHLDAAREVIDGKLWRVLS